MTLEEYAKTKDLVVQQATDSYPKQCPTIDNQLANKTEAFKQQIVINEPADIN